MILNLTSFKGLNWQRRLNIHLRVLQRLVGAIFLSDVYVSFYVFMFVVTNCMQESIILIVDSYRMLFFDYFAHTNIKSLFPTMS